MRAFFVYVLLFYSSLTCFRFLTKIFVPYFSRDKSSWISNFTFKNYISLVTHVKMAGSFEF